MWAGCRLGLAGERSHFGYGLGNSCTPAPVGENGLSCGRATLNDSREGGRGFSKRHRAASERLNILGSGIEEVDVSDRHRFCPKCGTQAGAGASFCGNCGQSLEKALIHQAQPEAIYLSQDVHSSAITNEVLEPIPQVETARTSAPVAELLNDNSILINRTIPNAIVTLEAVLRRSGPVRVDTTSSVPQLSGQWRIQTSLYPYRATVRAEGSRCVVEFSPVFPNVSSGLWNSALQQIVAQLNGDISGGPAPVQSSGFHPVAPRQQPMPPPPPNRVGIGYQTPAYPYISLPTKTNGLAIWALILGLIPVVPIAGSVLAIVFGNMGKGQIDRSGGRETGRGLAVAGIILGWLCIVGYTIIIALLVVAAVHSTSPPITGGTGNTG
jgi:hypothetical protein